MLNHRERADTNNWVINFEGGGTCSGEQSCYDRWCSTPPNPAVFERAGRMSSRGTPEAVSLGGIFSQAPADSNAFADYNHVYLYYCSSDNWIGSADRGVPIDPTTGIAITYDIEFQGEAIVNDAIATLRDGPTSADPIPTALFPGLLLPDLDEADEVIFTSESAGSMGLRTSTGQLTGFPTMARLEPYLTLPGIFGPNCGRHISLKNTQHFFGEGVSLPGGGVGGPMKGLSFHDLLVDWLNNGNPGEVQIDNPVGAPYTSSLCPQ